MRISSSDQVVGYPILLIRRLLATCQRGDLVVRDAERILEVDQTEARKALATLEQEGYLELCAEYLPHEQWRTTLKGNTLAIASAARPVSHTKAQQRLSEFLARVEQLNADDAYLYRVTKVALFGSMLSESPTVSDVDLAIQLVLRYEPAEMEARREQRVTTAIEAGRTFSNSMSWFTWPYTEVVLFLRNRSRVINLHAFDELEELATPYKILFDAEVDASSPVS